MASSQKDIDKLPAYSPPQYQRHHQFHDLVEKIMNHQKGSGTCQCGKIVGTQQDWAEHLADVIYPNSGEYESSS